MAIKYEVKYLDVENIEHKATISDPNYVGSVIEVNGMINFDAGDLDNPIEPIRGKAVSLSLEASTDLTFADLVSEQERTFLVEYYRDNVKLFTGWVNLENSYEDYVNDRWELQIDCLDGLSYLENLSFVNDNGTFITGTRTVLEIVTRCLQRTGILQNINISIGVFYEGLADTESTFENVNLGAGRFIKDDGNTIMDCKEVLNDMLSLFTASLTTHKGEWYIYRNTELFDTSTLTFFRYDSDGVALTPTTMQEDFAETLGSQINGFYPHHSGGNQTKTLFRAKSAVRINYKYGLVNRFYENVFLYYSGGQWDDWDILASIKLLNYGNDSYGAGFAYSDNPPSDDVLLRLSSYVTLTTNDNVKARLRITPTTSTGIPNTATFQYQIFVTDKVLPDNSAKFYYLTQAGGWGALNSEHVRTINTYATDINVEITIPQIPNEDYNLLYIQFRTAQPRNVSTNEGVLKLTEASIYPAQDQAVDDGVEGEFHTVLRENAPSSAIEDPIEVFNGDAPTDLWVGTLYKADGQTPTDFWYRKGETEQKALLEIMGRDILQAQAKPSIEFSGDIYGYIPYLSIVEIDGFTGSKFIFTKYQYNSKRNIITATLREIFNDDSVDMDYNVTLDFGETVKPTVIG